MVALRFRSNEVRLACCDLARLRRRWGPVVARRISHRLQQLEAMTTVADLAFLPFDFYEHGGGVVEVTVAEDLSLLIERLDMSEGEALMHEIIVTGLRDRSTSARTS